MEKILTLKNFKNIPWLLIVGIFYVLVLFFLNPALQILGVILLAFFLFLTEKLPIYATAILVMVLLIVLKLVTPVQGVSGFSNAATITVLCLFILSGSIIKAGLIQKLGRILLKFVKRSYSLQILILSLVAPLSGILNNTAIVATFLPMVIKLGEKSKYHPVKFLIPLSFLAMLGGTLTVIGTSANILANSILRSNNLPTFHIFEFTHIGFFVLIIGIIYFLTIGRLLLPEIRTGDKDKEVKKNNKFLAELQIKPESKFIGKTLNKLQFEKAFEVKVIKIIRGKDSYVKNIGNQKIKAGDILVFTADEQRIIDLDQRKNEKILMDFDEDKKRMPIGTGKIIKILFRISHLFKKSTFDEIKFAKRYSGSVIGICRKDIEVRRLADLKLKPGEIFLVKVAESALDELERSKDFLLLEEIEHEFDYRQAWKTLSIVAIVILLAAFNILPIMVATVIGVLLVFITGCLKTDELYKTVNWDVIFLLAGIIPLGIAMQESGAANLVANFILNITPFVSPLGLMITFYLITTILTEFISNNAAVVLLVPIVISVAAGTAALNPVVATLVVMFAASTSFLSPIGYQTNMMVYGAGNYKFTDFIRVGGILNLILMICTPFLIYYFFM